MSRKRKKELKLEKITEEEIESALIESKNCLSSKSHRTFEKMAEAFRTITAILEIQNTRIEKLEKELKGIKSEKSSKVFSRKEAEENKKRITACLSEEKEKKNPKGHGRSKAEEYIGAKREKIAHSELESGHVCCGCKRGKVYRDRPGVFIHIEGRPPIDATVYEVEKYRCNLCGEIYEAELPEEISEVEEDSRKHYDASAKSMMAILRYGYGFPLNRIEKLQSAFGVPLAASTAWDKTKEVACDIEPVYEELKRMAAQAEVVFHDDTGMKILQTRKEINQEVKKAEGKKTRTGIFTTGLVSIVGDNKIALFATGRKHAGENLKDLLTQRMSDRSPPIQMSDGKSGNVSKDTSTIPCYCNVHARRNFVDVAQNFPSECQYVLLEIYRKIYKNEAYTKEHSMSPLQRLEYHKEYSKPIMEKFQSWLDKQFDEKLVEENSSLGKAISYVKNHWEKLTRFLHIPGVPLDNNICERVLKTAICHRKNSLFYKTANGARIGDMFMCIIKTCYYAKVNPFQYITQLQKNVFQVSLCPSKWLPWNYHLQLNS